jgi:cell division septum initiation protein DivIVA
MVESMKIPQEIQSFNPDEFDFDDKDKVKALIGQLLNAIENLVQANQDIQKENQQLKDEINRLKGEKGKPSFKPNVSSHNYTPPGFRKETRKWKKQSKKSRVKIDRVEVLSVDHDILPEDAEFKGYRSVTVQNILFKTDNVEYRLERYYSPGEKKTYEARLPDEVDGEFGPDLKAFVIHQYFACRVSEKKILRTLTEAGIAISDGQISNVITESCAEEFTNEKDDIFETGMKSTDYFHIDDTGARHKGVNHHVQVNKIMMSDDAKQFMFLAVLHALCWIHEIRHYRKMNPSLGYNRAKLKEFLQVIYDFYEQLKEYKKYPTQRQKKFLEKRFDEICSMETGYKQLDNRIALTRKKREKLLMVLKYPHIPLHNNPAEIALRELVIKKKISYGTKSEKGRIAWENMMTIMDTCRKQNVSFMEYVKDIFSKRYSTPRLSTLILEKARVNTTGY